MLICWCLTAFYADIKCQDDSCVINAIDDTAVILATILLLSLIIIVDIIIIITVVIIINIVIVFISCS